MSQQTAASGRSVAKRGLPRQRYLAVVGTTVAVAGCVGGDSGSSGEDDNERSGDTGAESSGDEIGGDSSDSEARTDDCTTLVGDLTTYDISDTRLFFAFNYPSNWTVTNEARSSVTFAHPETIQSPTTSVKTVRGDETVSS